MASKPTFTASTLLEDDLRRRLQADAAKVLIVVGTGVSLATSGERCASWEGLLSHGIQRCQSVLHDLPADWGRRMDAQLREGDLTDLISVAEQISTRLKKHAMGEYQRWLKETVGVLKPKTKKHRALVEAIRRVGTRIATTNYDGLIENITGLEAVTWRDRTRFEAVLRGEESGVLHLHGFWRDAESIVMGIADYNKILGDDFARAMLQALRSTNTLVFVGFGDGLDDPHFQNLADWARPIFEDSLFRSFRLARKAEVSAIQSKMNSHDRIFPISYGDNYDDLPNFLLSLGQSKSSAAPAKRKTRGKKATQPNPIHAATLDDIAKFDPKTKALNQRLALGEEKTLAQFVQEEPRWLLTE